MYTSWVWLMPIAIAVADIKLDTILARDVEGDGAKVVYFRDSNAFHSIHRSIDPSRRCRARNEICVDLAWEA